ncbi:heme utilization protein HutZ [Vibrio salinus]|uniref:heme utilization protein HutZ n=1 Tax=Vibrio salinus TaxID=2899784 RepID=UPI001E3402B9|nr:heme utilization protein HutZ [Vibrio salinus]MCE0495926.1 heme utilization protein HutZ [Vibrio salinus]
MDSMVQKERLQHRLEPEIHDFREQCQTLQLATVDSQGNPNVSYAPFVYNEEGYFVLISEIARHARNLHENRSLSMMMIEDEGSSKQLYARKRLTFDARANFIERESDKWHQIIRQLQERFGPIINNLSQMKDFKLYHLTTEKGLYVKGFGKAYHVSSEDLIDFVHLDKGHEPVSKMHVFPELQKV